jgi:hypothetical protein
VLQASATSGAEISHSQQLAQASARSSSPSVTAARSATLGSLSHRQPGHRGQRRTLPSSWRDPLQAAITRCRDHPTAAGAPSGRCPAVPPSGPPRPCPRAHRRLQSGPPGVSARPVRWSRGAGRPGDGRAGSAAASPPPEAAPAGRRRGLPATSGVARERSGSPHEALERCQKPAAGSSWQTIDGLARCLRPFGGASGQSPHRVGSGGLRPTRTIAGGAWTHSFAWFSSGGATWVCIGHPLRVPAFQIIGTAEADAGQPFRGVKAQAGA